MNIVKTSIKSGFKLTLKFKCFLLFVMFLFQGVQVSTLYGGTLYTTSILDSKQNESVFLNAIKSGSVDEVRSLINSGCDVNERNKYGYTPLMSAVYKGNVEIVSLLISAGADLESFDNQGNTPFMYAFYGAEDRKSIVEFLLSLNVNAKTMNKQEFTPLVLATLNNHCNSMKLLIEYGINIEKKESGSTPLMHAAGNQNIEPAKLLIQYGANLETRDSWGFTPLMLAAFHNDGNMIREFIKAGAVVDARTTRRIPVSIKKDWRDFFPKTEYIPSGSTALDIAKQFEKRFAENVLINDGHAE